MKMFRLLTGITALLAIALVGCGTQSPDFSPVLKSVQISYTALKPRTNGVVAVGDKLQFNATGLCTTPPGTKATDPDVVSKTIGTESFLLKPCGISLGGVAWSVDNSGAGSIGSTTGLFTAGPGTGTVEVKGTVSGISGTANVDTTNVDVTPVLLDKLLVDPKSPPPVAKDGMVTFKVTGVGSDGNPIALDPATITWTKSCDDSVATISSTTGTSTIATAVATSGTCTITASSDDNTNGDPVDSDSGVFTISTDVALKHLVSAKLTPPSAAKPVGGTQDYQLMGVYGDGGTHAVPNADINWTVSPAAPNAVATLADNATDTTKETATGVKVGLATITATLKDASTLDDPTKNFATGTLTVVDARCSAPLSNQNIPAASINVAKTGVSGGICLGCSVGTPEGAIDADPTGTSATLNNLVALGLPNPTLISLTVNAGQLVPAGGKPGFIVQDPTGALLSANLLGSTIVLDTLDAAGNVLEGNGTASYLPSGLLVNPLDLTLLGLGNGGTVVSLANPTTSAFSAIRITFIPGLVGALFSVNVSSACADTAAVP